MYIESIDTTGKNKCKIHLSNGVDLTLYKGEVRQLHLQENDEITEDMYEEVLEEILIPRARRRAMHLLEKMDRSTRQLETKLCEGGYPEPAIESAIAYVTSYHYLDDERLARSHIRFYQTSRSRMRMTQDLLKKGIDREIIDRCMEEELEQSQVELIAVLLQKKGYDPENATRQEEAKMYRFLMQRGFASSEISRVLRGGFSEWD